MKNETAGIKVSVIMPVYNTEKYLQHTLQSLKAQTLREVEFICVNDGSSDNSLEVLKRFASADARFVVIDQANSGASVARNAGLRVARGEYLSILDSDDLFELRMLEESYSFAKMMRADMVVFRADQYLEKKNRYKPTPWTMKAAQLPASPIFAFSDVLSNRFQAIQGWTWDKLFRREFVSNNKILFQEQRIYNDMLFTFSAYIKARRIATLDALLIHQRKRGGGSLSDEGAKEWCSLYSALASLRDVLEKDGLYSQYECDFVNYVIRMILYHSSLCSDAQNAAFLKQVEKEWDPVFNLFGRDESFYRPLSNMGMLRCACYNARSF